MKHRRHNHDDVFTLLQRDGTLSLAAGKGLGQWLHVCVRCDEVQCYPYRHKNKSASRVEHPRLVQIQAVRNLERNQGYCIVLSLVQDAGP